MQTHLKASWTISNVLQGFDIINKDRMNKKTLYACVIGDGSFMGI